MGHSIAYGTFIPIGMFSAIAIIASEAASMEEREPLPGSNKQQNQAAKCAFKTNYGKARQFSNLLYRINQKAILFVLAANIASWFLGSFAVYYVKVYLYTAVLVSNVLLGVAIFIFHTAGNPRVI